MRRWTRAKQYLTRAVLRMRRKGCVHFSGKDDKLERNYLRIRFSLDPEYRHTRFSHRSDDNRLAHLERIIHETSEDAKTIETELATFGFHQRRIPILDAYGAEKDFFIYTRDLHDTIEILVDRNLETGKPDVHLYGIHPTKLYRWLDMMRYARMPP